MTSKPLPTVSVSTGSFYVYPLRAALRLIADAGYSAVELVVGPEVWLRGCGYVARLAREHGLEILSVHPPILPFPGWTDIPASLPRLARMTLDLQAAVLCIHPPDVPSADSTILRRFVSALREALGLLAGTNTRLALENLAHFTRKDAAFWLHNPENLAAFAEEMDIPLVLDTAHADSTSLGLDGVYALFRGRIANVHLSDVRHMRYTPRTKYLQTLFTHHQLPGNGCLSLEALLGDLLARGYGGPLTLELSPTALGIWSLRTARRRLIEAREWAETTLASAVKSAGEV